MQDSTPELFFEAATSYHKTAAMMAAIDLGLFTAIAEGADTPAALAAKVGAAERGARILADYLTIHGFLTKAEGVYALTPSSATFLDERSPAYLGAAKDFLAAPEFLAMVFADPARAVRSGESLGLGNIGPDNPIWIKFARGMAASATPTARAVAAHAVAGLTTPEKVLDVAAGHGMYGVSVALAAPGARVTALDWAGVLEVARANAEKFGVADRFQEIAGSAFDVDWGDGYDLILLPNFLHHFDPGACASLLAKVRRVLAPAGRAFAVEFVPNPDRISPPRPAAFALVMLFSTPNGDAYTLAELDAMGRQAGFRGIVATPLPPAPQTLVEFLL
ncbi:class I SAM-dependent methyltransferase [Roseiarcus sp.]|uniref:class I SAM-dependent methyltransferase n=1 Tax=Roseiarcus sp. TaxID=1969460 RepID=UPI003C3F0B7A